MRTYIVHAVAWTLGILVHVDGRPLGRSRPAQQEGGGSCGALSTRGS